MWLHAIDNEIANLDNVKDITRVYATSKANIVTLNPTELKKKSIGHMGFFSSKNKELWKHTTQWFDKIYNTDRIIYIYSFTLNLKNISNKIIS